MRMEQLVEYVRGPMRQRDTTISEVKEPQLKGNCIEFTPHNFILSPQRKKRYNNRRFYIGNAAAEEWERQRCFYGESHAQFAAHLLAVAQHATCLECH